MLVSIRLSQRTLKATQPASLNNIFLLSSSQITNYLMLRLTRPLRLLLAALTYSFGTSLADHLGKPFRADSFWLGIVMILLLQVAMNLLPEVYRPHNEPFLENETRGDQIKLRNNVLYISLASLVSIATLAYILYINYQLPLTAFYFLVLSIILVLIHSIPPFRVSQQ